MRKFVMTLALAGVLIAGLATAPVLYAQEPQGPAQHPDGSMMGRKSHMMEMCGRMMQGGVMGDHSSPKPDKK